MEITNEPILVIPTMEPGENFGDYEKRIVRFLLKELPTSLKCPTPGCPGGVFSNKGVSGNPSQGGFQRISLRCRNIPLEKDTRAGTPMGCGKTARLEAVLINSNMQHAAEYVANAHAEAGKKNLSKTHGKQPSVASLFKAVPKTVIPTNPVVSILGLGVSSSAHARGVSPEALPQPILKRKKSEPEVETVQMETTANTALNAELSSQQQLAQMSQLLQQVLQTLSAIQKENSSLRAEVNALKNSRNQSAPSRSPARDFISRSPSPGNERQSRATTRAPRNQTQRSVSFNPPQARQQGQLGTSYASVAQAAANRPVTSRRHNAIAAKMLAPKTRPAANFSKVYVTVTDNRALKRCQSMADVNATVRASLKYYGVNNLVHKFSKIGNSLLELYFVEENEEELIERLHNKSVQYSYDMPTERPGVQLQLPAEVLAAKTVNRLTRLYERAKFVKLREAILRGHPEAIRNTVLAAAEAATTPAPVATLTGSNYTTDHGFVFPPVRQAPAMTDDQVMETEPTLSNAALSQ
jgi:hypothetical protein